MAATPYRVDSTRSNAGRGATPLDVTEQHRTGIEAGPLADLVGDELPDAPEPHVTELVDLSRADVERARSRFGPFGDDDDRREAATLVTADESCAHILDVERALGNEDCGRAAGDARMRGDPAAVTAHHLDDHHAIVRLGRGVESIDRIGGDLDSGVEPERDLGALDVVVDRLRHADDRQSALGVQLAGEAQRPVATDDDQRPDAHVGQRRLHLVHTVGQVVRTATAGTEHRAAAGQQAAHRFDGEWHRPPIHDTVPGVEEPDDLVTENPLPFAHDGAEYGVETRAVAPTGQYTYTHGIRSYAPLLGLQPLSGGGDRHFRPTRPGC